MNGRKYKQMQGLVRHIRRFTAPLVLAGAIATSIGLYAVPATADYYCGSNKGAIKTSIDFGCRGTNCKNAATAGDSFCAGDHTGIVDMLFAIIRFLSAGVGIVVVGSVVYAGIQYTTSRGDPNATGAAVKRIRNTTIALGVYIFAYAILNYLIPAGFFT